MANPRRPTRAALVAILLALVSGPSVQQAATPPAEKWVTVWAASAHGPYPLGNPSAQPDQRFSFPDPARGAENQTFRLIVRPDLWGERVRLRFSNVYGRQPLVLDDAFVGLQAWSGNLLSGTNRPVTFNGKPLVTIPPGALTWSDLVDLPFVRNARPRLDGRNLAVSFHVAGSSGPMTWHAKALATSYVSPPGSGSLGRDPSDARFPYSTGSWFFLDAIDVMAPAATTVVVCFGDSITDGTASTMNGDDRWPDVLSSRVHAAYGDRVVVVNAGIGGNRVVGPNDYAANPIAGGPGALDRLDRDVLDLSGVTSVIWLEGINDLGTGATVEAVTAGFRQGVARMKAKHVAVIGATLTSALNATNGTHGAKDVDEKRHAVNQFIRSSGVFDAVVDFDAAVLDPQTGEMRQQFQPNSTIGGVGDKLHPNRAGYAAMAAGIDLRLLAPPGAVRKEGPRH